MCLVYKTEQKNYSHPLIQRIYGNVHCIVLFTHLRILPLSMAALAIL